MSTAACIDPTRAAFNDFNALRRNTPIETPNPVCFRTLAPYPNRDPHSGRAPTGEGRDR